jgi:hypothetical protein
MNANPYIADHWSAEQALAVYELLDALREQVWEGYGEQITEQMRREYAEQQARAQLELSFNDEIPF